MRFVVGLLFAGLLLVGVFASGNLVSAGTTVDEVASEMICMCGCRSQLPACSMPECGVKPKMMNQIKVMLDEGRGKDEIIQYFLNAYGEEVLAVPAKQGFNWIAWLTPFAAIITGGVFVFLAVDQWVLRRGQRSGEEEVVEEEFSPRELSRYEARLKKELDQDEGGSK